VKTLKILSIAVPLTTLVLWGAIALAQMWAKIMSSDTFAKLTASAAIIIVISIVLTISVRGYIENAELKRQGYLDE
jgi:hypothetical protein